MSSVARNAPRKSATGVGTGRTNREHTRLALVRRARRVLRCLGEGYPNAHCELDFASPLDLLVAVILSAQTSTFLKRAFWQRHHVQG